MSDILSRNWWAVALRGAAAVIFGILALIWPGITLYALVLIFGAYALVDGAFTLAAAAGRSDPDAPTTGRGWLIARGVAGIALGLLTVFWPRITAVALLWTIAAWAVVTGVLEIVTAIRLRRVLRREWLLALNGVLAVVFGILLVVWPATGALALVILIGVAALVFGVMLLVEGFRLRRLSRGRHVPIGEQQRPATA